MAATRSFIVVIRGPEATAGSILSFLNIIGIAVPETLDKTMDISIAAPMQAETAKANVRSCCLKRYI